MTRQEWLQSLKEGELVEVFIGPNSKGLAVVQRASKTQVTLWKHGKAKRFRRSDGLICGNPYRRHLFKIERPVESSSP